jgi:hypothetical protein
MIKKKSAPAIISLLIIIFIALAIFFFIYYKNSNKSEINDFASCAAAGYPIMKSYPRQCRANGQTFVEIIDEKNLY